MKGQGRAEESFSSDIRRLVGNVYKDAAYPASMLKVFGSFRASEYLILYYKRVFDPVLKMKWELLTLVGNGMKKPRKGIGAPHVQRVRSNQDAR